MWTTNALPSMISTNWTLTLLSGKNPKPKEIHLSREAAISPVWSPRRISSLFSEDGTSFYNSTTCSSMILKPKLGPTHKSAMRSPNGIWGESSPPASPLGNISSLEAHLAASSKVVTEPEPNMKTLSSIWTLTT